MKNTFLTIILSIPTIICAQLYNADIAIIKDVDGYTLIRKSQTKQSDIQDTLFADEFFWYLENDTSNWFEVHQIMDLDVGFIHNSRVLNVKELIVKDQENLIFIMRQDLILFLSSLYTILKKTIMSN